MSADIDADASKIADTDCVTWNAVQRVLCAVLLRCFVGELGQHKKACGVWQKKLWF